MTSHAPSGTSSGPRAKRPFASPRTIRFLAEFCLVVGVIAAVAGVGYTVNGATQAEGPVVVPVTARREAVIEAGSAGSDGGASTVLTRGVGYEWDALRLDLPGAGEGTWLEVQADAFMLRSWGSTVSEQLLARGGVAVLGLCVGGGAVLLRRLLLSVADGRPFDPGNAARIAGIAGLVVVASLANSFLPIIGTHLVLTRAGLAGAESPVIAGSTLPLTPLLVAAILLALAEAFRRGTELAQDVDGLV